MNKLSTRVLEAIRERVREACPCDVCRKGERLLRRPVEGSAQTRADGPRGPVRLVPRIRLAS